MASRKLARSGEERPPRRVGALLSCRQEAF